MTLVNVQCCNDRVISNSKTLAKFLSQTDSLAIVSGAGVSTASGIPDYRDRDGVRKHSRPIQYQDFVNKADSRKRYWARSYVGWHRFSKARPNAAHEALADLEVTGKIDTLITQNVDRLHQSAGSRRVIDLHGDLSQVYCIGCGELESRGDYQQRLKSANPDWRAGVLRERPDGDVELADESHGEFAVPGCVRCEGIVKPDVVMFGESVPRSRVADASAAVFRADALLVVGSSLMVFSGFRFARQAAEQKKPIVIVNQGRTRADEFATLKVDADCANVLAAAIELI